jgi:hypothetical protein
MSRAACPAARRGKPEKGSESRTGWIISLSKKSSMPSTTCGWSDDIDGRQGRSRIYRKRARKAPCFSKGMQSASAEGGFEVNSESKAQGRDRCVPGSTGLPPTPASMRSTAASTCSACCLTRWDRPARRCRVRPPPRYASRQAGAARFCRRHPGAAAAPGCRVDARRRSSRRAASPFRRPPSQAHSINSMLQRARETLAKRYPDGQPRRRPGQRRSSSNCSALSAVLGRT